MWEARPDRRSSRLLYVSGAARGSDATASRRARRSRRPTARATRATPSPSSSSPNSGYRWDTRVDLALGSVSAEEISLLFSALFRAPEGRTERELREDYTAAFPARDGGVRARLRDRFAARHATARPDDERRDHRGHSIRSLMRGDVSAARRISRQVPRAREVPLRAHRPRRHRAARHLGARPGDDGALSPRAGQAHDALRTAAALARLAAAHVRRLAQGEDVHRGLSRHGERFRDLEYRSRSRVDDRRAARAEVGSAVPHRTSHSLAAAPAVRGRRAR